MSSDEIVRGQASGIIARRDRRLGLVAFSPHTALVYSVAPSCVDDVLTWIESGGNAPSEAFAYSLGAGWHTPLSDSRQPELQLLPSADAWKTSDFAADRPLVVNWLFTGQCQMACDYCYAEDLMRGRSSELDLARLRTVADRILELSPVAIVLTGGEPLTSPHLPELVRHLSRRAGVIVDTNGWALDKKHIDLFRQHDIAVRVSLDSERPAENEKYRRLSTDSRLACGGPTHSAVATIVSLLDAGITTCVQTVATRFSASDLRSLGDKLYRMGVRSWRIHRVANSAASGQGFLRARVDDKAYAHDTALVRRALACDWGSAFAIQFAGNQQRNSVILVAPDGRFLTEMQPQRSTKTSGQAQSQKILIDPKNPVRPRISMIRENVNMWAHASRYLNLSVD